MPLITVLFQLYVDTAYNWYAEADLEKKPAAVFQLYVDTAYNWYFMKMLIILSFCIRFSYM